MLSDERRRPSEVVFALTSPQVAVLAAGVGGAVVKWPDFDQRTLTSLLARGLLRRTDERRYVLTDAGEAARAMCEIIGIAAGAQAGRAGWRQ